MNIDSKQLTIRHIPAVLYGNDAPRVFLHIHGKGGCKEEAISLAQHACPKGWQVLSIDMPEHGERKSEPGFDPWHVVPELRDFMGWARERWNRVALYANSIGAWFSMLAFADCAPERSLFLSPVLDMPRLINRMMGWAGVDQQALEEQGTIQTNFGETLSWQYYQYAAVHPIGHWESPTAILYADGDHLTERDVVSDFAERFACQLTVAEGMEHWFHTPEQLAFLDRWLERQLRPAIEVSAALIWDGGRFLICQRPPHKARGMQWEFPGGKVEPGESGAQALVRECQEELGVTLTVLHTVTDVTYPYPDITVHLTLFSTVIHSGTFQNREHLSFRWITVPEIPDYDFCPADRHFLNAVAAEAHMRSQL